MTSSDDPAALVAAIRADHTRHEYLGHSFEVICAVCGVDWPCDAARAADMIERLMDDGPDIGMIHSHQMAKALAAFGAEKARANRAEAKLADIYAFLGGARSKAQRGSNDDE